MLTTLSPSAGTAASGAEFTIPDGVCGAEQVSSPSEGHASPGVTDRVNIRGVGATPQDLNTAVATLERWRAERRQVYVCVVSVHGLVMAQRDPTIRRPQPLRHGDRRRHAARVVVAARGFLPGAPGVAPICSMRRALTECRVGSATTSMAPLQK